MVLSRDEAVEATGGVVLGLHIQQVLTAGLMTPNARCQPPLEAGATQERTL